LNDKENARKAVRDTLAYYDKRTGADNIKSLETRIAKARKDIEEMTTAFIEAKSALLRESIEKRMTDYERLIKDLESQKTQLEYERGLQVSENDILDYICSLSNMTSIAELGRDTLKAVLEKEMVNGILNIPKEYGMFICRN